jgi:hypothetical protein
LLVADKEGVGAVTDAVNVAGVTEGVGHISVHKSVLKIS